MPKNEYANMQTYIQRNLTSRVSLCGIPCKYDKWKLIYTFVCVPYIHAYIHTSKSYVAGLSLRHPLQVWTWHPVCLWRMSLRHLYLCMYVCMYVCIYIYSCMCIYIYICMYNYGRCTFCGYGGCLFLICMYLCVYVCIYMGIASSAPMSDVSMNATTHTYI